MLCNCGHPAHHHKGGYCFTTTVTGPKSEYHSYRSETRCDCMLYRPQDEVAMADDASDW